MRADSWSRFDDSDLLRHLAELVAQERSSTAALVACIAEVDARRLYLLAGFQSMRIYCVEVLHLCDDAAYKRITAARLTRDFPILLTALEEGRLHLTAVLLLAPHLTRENAQELVDAATHQTRAQIEQLLARRFPRTEVLSMVYPAPASADTRLSPASEPAERGKVRKSSSELAPERVHSARRGAKVAPLSASSFELHGTINGDTHQLMCQAQALLSHVVGPNDLDGLLKRAFEALVGRLEKQKLGATSRPQRKRRPVKSRRHIPAAVKRAVLERDGRQCTYVGTNGHRCSARTRLQFDHVLEVARGGDSSVDNVRIRCASHNQFTAERTFGASFMRNKREEARAAKQRKRGQAEAAAAERTAEIIPCLRTLGMGADDARRAAESCAAMGDAPLEARVKAALAFYGARIRPVGRTIRALENSSAPPTPGP